MYTNDTHRSGFTIVELLIAVVVISILVVISIVTYTGIRQRSHDASTEVTLNQAAKATKSFDLQTPPTSTMGSTGVKDALIAGKYLSTGFDDNLRVSGPNSSGRVYIAWCGKNEYLLAAEVYSGGVDQTTFDTLMNDCQVRWWLYIYKKSPPTPGAPTSGPQYRYSIREIK